MKKTITWTAIVCSLVLIFCAEVPASESDLSNNPDKIERLYKSEIGEGVVLEVTARRQPFWITPLLVWETLSTIHHMA